MTLTFCLLLGTSCRKSSAGNIIFTNSSEPDQVRQNVGHDLDPQLFDTLKVFLKDSLKKLFLKKNRQMTKSLELINIILSDIKF